MRTLPSFALVLASFPGLLAAQAAPAAPAPAPWAAAVEAAFRAYDARDWQALAPLADPSALARFRQNAIEVRRTLAAMPEDHGARGRVSRASRRREYEAWTTLPAESVFVRMARELIDPAYARPELRPTVTRQLLGHAVEGDTLVHVVFRYDARWAWPTAARPLEESRVDVLTLRRAAYGWRPTLNGGLTAPLLPPATLMVTEQ